MLSVTTSSDVPSRTPCLSLSSLTHKHVIRFSQSAREYKHVCFLQIDLIHVVEMGWLHVEPTVPSSVNQSSDFLNSVF